MLLKELRSVGVKSRAACPASQPVAMSAILAAGTRLFIFSLIEVHAVEDEAQDYHGRSGEDRIEDHRLEIPLQALPRSRADAGNGDTDEFHHLAGSHGIEDLEAVEELKDECNHGVGGRDGQVHHDLYNQYQVDARAEHVVHLLLFTVFFHIKRAIKN